MRLSTFLTIGFGMGVAGALGAVVVLSKMNVSDHRPMKPIDAVPVAESILAPKAQAAETETYDSGQMTCSLVRDGASEEIYGCTVREVRHTLERIDFRFDFGDGSTVTFKTQAQEGIGYQVTKVITNGSNDPIDSGSCNFGDGEVACVVAKGASTFMVHAMP